MTDYENLSNKCRVLTRSVLDFVKVKDSAGETYYIYPDKYTDVKLNQSFAGLEVGTIIKVAFLSSSVSLLCFDVKQSEYAAILETSDNGSGIYGEDEKYYTRLPNIFSNAFSYVE